MVNLDLSMMIESRLNLANQYLEDAKMLLQEGRWNSAVGRAYYASYQAMCAALGEPVEGNIWRHLAIIKHFVRGYWFLPTHPENIAGLFEHLRLPLRRLYMERVRVDYDAATLNEVSAKNAVQTVEAVLKVIKEGG